MAAANSTNNIGFPKFITIWPNALAKAHTNWGQTTGTQATVIHRVDRFSSGAQNAEISWDVALAAGTYTIQISHNTDTNRGIYSVQINSVEVGTIDGYSGSTAANVSSSLTGITVSTSGRHELKFRMATKNASSSSYLGDLNLVSLRRTA